MFDDVLLVFCGRKAEWMVPIARFRFSMGGFPGVFSGEPGVGAPAETHTETLQRGAPPHVAAAQLERLTMMQCVPKWHWCVGFKRVLIFPAPWCVRVLRACFRPIFFLR